MVVLCADVSCNTRLPILLSQYVTWLLTRLAVQFRLLAAFIDAHATTPMIECETLQEIMHCPDQQEGWRIGGRDRGCVTERTENVALTSSKDVKRIACAGLPLEAKLVISWAWCWLD